VLFCVYVLNIAKYMDGGMKERSIIEWLFDDDFEFVDRVPLRPVGPTVC